MWLIYSLFLLKFTFLWKDFKIYYSPYALEGHSKFKRSKFMLVVATFIREYFSCAHVPYSHAIIFSTPCNKGSLFKHISFLIDCHICENYFEIIFEILKFFILQMCYILPGYDCTWFLESKDQEKSITCLIEISYYSKWTSYSSKESRVIY